MHDFRESPGVIGAGVGSRPTFGLSGPTRGCPPGLLQPIPFRGVFRAPDGPEQGTLGRRGPLLTDLNRMLLEHGAGLVAYGVDVEQAAKEVLRPSELRAPESAPRGDEAAEPVSQAFLSVRFRRPDSSGAGCAPTVAGQPWT